MNIADIDLASVDHVLMTTRAVGRRLDLTRPVEREVIEGCIEIAIQAPTASLSSSSGSQNASAPLNADEAHRDHRENRARFRPKCLTY